MLCRHPGYNLGDKDAEEPTDPCLSLCLYLYLYDHSGLTMSTRQFSCPWDSGQVGVIYVTYKQLREWFGWKRITQKRMAQTIEWLEGEVETYDQYLTGDVYGIVLKDKDGEAPDSGWGLYGLEYARQELNEMADLQLDLMPAFLPGFEVVKNG